MKDFNLDFLQSMREIFKEDYDKFYNSMDQKSKSGLRINTLKIDEDKFLERFYLCKVPWCSSGFYTEEDGFSKNILYQCGLYYIQEPSAMSPASFLPIESDDKVLDMCASPGGKATFLGEKLKGTGVLVTNDISNKRARILARNIEKHGIQNYTVLNESHDKLEKAFPHYFDKILVDAPCSGEGMFRKDPKVLSNWTSQSPNEFFEIQKDILSSAVNMLKGGGYIMYSTCTFNTLENEEVIKWFLEEHKDFELIPFGDEYFEKGFLGMDTYRILPHKQEGEGHFLALLHRVSEMEEKGLNVLKTNIDSATYKEVIKHFNKEVFNFDLEEFLNKGNLILYKHEDSIFCVPNELPKGVLKLRTVRSGLLLCDLLIKGKKTKIQPSSVFMYPFKATDFKNYVSIPYEFALESEFLDKFLKGETIILEEDIDYFKDKKDGFLIFAVDDYPLGYGINQDGKVKNKYNKNWLQL